MKYALIGCGRVAGSHIKAAKNNNLEIVALCDIVPEKAKDLAEKFGIETKIYSDYKLMLSQMNPDFVAIAAISGVHAEIAEYCAENGFNFVVEKPMAMSIEDANKIIKLSADSKIEVNIDVNKTIEEQNISEESKNMLSLIYYKYIANNNEKKELIKLWEFNDKI